VLLEHALDQELSNELLLLERKPVLGVALLDRDCVLAALCVAPLTCVGRPLGQLGVDLVDGRVDERNHVIRRVGRGARESVHW
jgi:hypothetical protein